MGTSIGKFARKGRGVIVLVLAVFVLMPVAFFVEVQAADCWAPDRMQEPMGPVQPSFGQPGGCDQALWDDLTQATREVDFAALRGLLR